MKNLDLTPVSNLVRDSNNVWYSIVNLSTNLVQALVWEAIPSPRIEIIYFVRSAVIFDSAFR